MQFIFHMLVPAGLLQSTDFQICSYMHKMYINILIIDVKYVLFIVRKIFYVVCICCSYCCLFVSV